MLLNATLLLVNAPPLGVPSNPACLSVNRPIRRACAFESGAPGAVGSWDSDTSLTTGSKGSELDDSSRGTSRSRWTGRAGEEEASAFEDEVGSTSAADAGATAAEGAAAASGAQRWGSSRRGSVPVKLRRLSQRSKRGTHQQLEPKRFPSSRHSRRSSPRSLQTRPVEHGTHG